MKTSVLIAASACCCLVSCDRKESAAGNPEAAPLPSSEMAEQAPPAAIRVTEPEDFKVAEEEPGSVEIVEPSPTPGQRLDHAIEKSEDGVRRAAEKTGGALRRAGEAIERKAEEHSR